MMNISDENKAIDAAVTSVRIPDEAKSATAP